MHVIKKLTYLLAAAGCILIASPAMAGGSITGTNTMLTTYSVPQDCKKYELNGKQFLELIQTIISHGDLSDTTFMENTLGTKFQLQSGQPAHGKAELYLADSVLNAPVHIELRLDHDSTTHFTSAVRIENQPQAVSGRNFFTECLHLTPSEFSYHFGEPSVQTLSTDGSATMNASRRLATIGKNGEKLSVIDSYSYGAKVITGIVIRQEP